MNAMSSAALVKSGSRAVGPEPTRAIVKRAGVVEPRSQVGGMAKPAAKAQAQRETRRQREGPMGLLPLRIAAGFKLAQSAHIVVIIAADGHMLILD